MFQKGSVTSWRLQSMRKPELECILLPYSCAWVSDQEIWEEISL